MRSIYKYASLKTAKKILSNECVMLNSPKNFNDPYDCDFSIEKMDFESSLELIYNSELLSNWII